MLKISTYRPAWNRADRNSFRCDKVEVGDFVYLETSRAVYNRAEIIKAEPTRYLIRYGVKRKTEWVPKNHCIQIKRYDRYNR